jgi:ATP-dependent protease Clp ATPase subunit
LDPLTKDDLVRILTEPKNAIVKQYQALLAAEGVELVVTPEALNAVAEEALRRKTGARALKSIIEEIMLDVMFELHLWKASDNASSPKKSSECAKNPCYSAKASVGNDRKRRERCL